MKHKHPETPADEAGNAAMAGDPAAVEAAATDLPPADSAEARIAALEADLAQVLDARLRAEAEMANARRRALREIDDAERRGAERTLVPALTAADDLDRALEAAAQAGDTDGALATGVTLVLTRLLDALAADGITPIVPLGEVFDPRRHEALVHSPHPTVPAGHVAQVIARGWQKGDRLLRAARVLVSSGPADPGEGA